MKKYIVLCAGLCLALGMTSCGTKESAYKKAYEKAKQYDTQTATTTTAPQQTTAQPTYEEPAVVAPVQTRPSNEVRQYDNYDNVAVRQEHVAVVSGNGLKAYSVVVGSFGLQSNAEGLQQRLRNAGYDAQIVKNEDRNMFRVVAATFDNKVDAARSRDQFRAQDAYKDAWLLSNQ